ncbi:helix-turn-helix domain-containing protein [Leptolyngbya ohadii]|uniref:helix-turn-helix domain-containing protein n=1 Tax=Leptolyngbya ohadii TaxID=1962290 RepID=UPI0019D46A1F|nr:helix-turn-helix domain-containing protein [Leptolyngbya ohadii]
MTGRSTPQNLGPRELALYNLYRNCQLSMTPQQFYSRWDVTHAQIAQICGCSTTTVDRWFTTTALQSLPRRDHMRKLAEMNFLWEHYEEIPDSIRQHLCPPPDQSTRS